MKVYSPSTDKGRHVAGHDVHHKTADQPRSLANKQAKQLKHAARQHGKDQTWRHIAEEPRGVDPSLVEVEPLCAAAPTPTA